MSSNKVEQMATHGESARATGWGVSELSLPDMGETVSVVIGRASSVVVCTHKTQRNPFIDFGSSMNGFKPSASGFGLYG
jgi:hypothetical protein